MNMKKIILIITILVTTSIYTQNSDIIKITTSASGITKEIAIQDALRSALEQSYGSFISTKTNIKNDELLKDEIVAITSGEIHDYELVSETKIESGYAVTIVAKISKSVLNNFVTQSGGDAIIFDANVFSTKIRLQRLNENAEIKSINNILEILEEIYGRSIEFEFTSSNPKINEKNKKWRVDFELTTKYNENIINFIDYFSSSIEKIAMTEKQKTAYEELGKSTYPILVNNELYYFRNEASYISINNFLINLRNKFAQVDIETNEGLQVARSGWFKKNKNYLKNFFIPYLNHSQGYGLEFNSGYIHDDGNVKGGNYSLSFQSTKNKYVYFFGPSGQYGTLSGSRWGSERKVPTGTNRGNIVLMLNKDNKIRVKRNDAYVGSIGIKIGDVKGDGGNITAGGESLFMENILDFEFSFNPKNKEIIYVDGIELTIDQYLSQNNFIKPTYYTLRFTGGGLQASYPIRWTGIKMPVEDINNLNFSKKKMKRIQKRINNTKIDLDDIKLKLQNLINSIKIGNKKYNNSRDINHVAKYNFFHEFTEDEMFSITGYKLINTAKNSD